jgi:hypothetical protein
MMDVQMVELMVVWKAEMLVVMLVLMMDVQLVYS